MCASVSLKGGRQSDCLDALWVEIVRVFRVGERRRVDVG